MSTSTHGNLESRNLFTNSITGRDLGEGVYSDLTLRAGGGSDDTRRVSLQIHDGAQYIEQMAVSKRGLNIANVVVRDSVFFELGDENRTGSISSRKIGDMAEIAIRLDGKGPGKQLVFNSLAGARFDMPSQFDKTMKARDLRVHGPGATFVDDGVEEATITALDGAMTFNGTHHGDASFNSCRLKAGHLNGTFRVNQGSRFLYMCQTRSAFWTTMATDDSNLATSTSAEDGHMVVHIGSDSRPALDVHRDGATTRKLNADVVHAARVSVDEQMAVHGLVSCNRLHADITHANEAHAVSFESAKITSSDMQTRTLSVEGNLSILDSTDTGHLRVRKQLVASTVETSHIHTTDLSSMRIDAPELRIQTITPFMHGAAIEIRGRVQALDMSTSKLTASTIDVISPQSVLHISEMGLHFNELRPIQFLDHGSTVRIPKLHTDSLETKRVKAPEVSTASIRSLSGFYGNIDVVADGVSLGNIRIDSSAIIEVLDSNTTPHSGILEVVARNGMLIRSGAELLGSFEAPMWQVIRGQGVRQTGSLYMITPSSSSYVKMEPPSSTDDAFTLYVNTTGLSEVGIQIEPGETRIPRTLIIGSELAATCGSDGDGLNINEESLTALNVRHAAEYGGPVAIFHNMSRCVDAGIVICAEANTALVTLQTASGTIRVEHRADANSVSFHNENTGNDFLAVDTVTGLARVFGDLLVGGSLYFGSIAPGSGQGNGEVSFDQGLNVKSGILALGNVILSAEDDLKRTLNIDALAVHSPVIYASSFAISEPPNGSKTRTFAFNAFVDSIGIVRHMNEGSAAVLSHTVRMSGETLPSSLRLGFSPRSYSEGAFADVTSAFEWTERGDMYARSTLDNGYVHFKQSTTASQVQFETSRSAYTFDKNIHIFGSLKLHHLSTSGSQNALHSMQSSADGVTISGVPATPHDGTAATPSAIILNDGVPGGKRWRIRMSQTTGELVFEHQESIHSAWASKFSIVQH